jgi:hypothetical protein
MHLTFDRERNMLWVSLRADAGDDLPGQPRDALVDVSTQGRIVGVELDLGDVATASAVLQEWLADPLAGAWTSIDRDGSAYVQLSASDVDAVRSARVSVVPRYTRSGMLAAFGIPRRGTGYEITYPSGNR